MLQRTHLKLLVLAFVCILIMVFILKSSIAYCFFVEKDLFCKPVIFSDVLLGRFFTRSLKYAANFKYIYPAECKMPSNISSKEFFIVWLDIFNNLRNRPYYLRYHRWFKKFF